MAHDSSIGNVRKSSESSSDDERDVGAPEAALKVILAIDIGSSSTRCSAWVAAASEGIDPETEGASRASSTLAFVKPLRFPRGGIDDADGSGRDDQGDHDGRLLVASVRPVRALHPTTGRIRSVFDLLTAVDDVVQETLERLREHWPPTNTSSAGFEVVGVGFTSFVMNLVGVDERGVPVNDDRATLSYACHTPEVASQVRALKRQLKEEHRLQLVYETTGAPIHASYALPQLRDLYHHHPDVARKVAQWQTLPSCCLSRWFGVPHVPITYSEASWTGLLDHRTCQYATCVRDLLSASCWRALPDLCDYDDFPRRGLPEHSPYYERWSELRHSTEFFLGVGDGACATIGSKCTSASRISCTIGTSAAARICVEAPIVSVRDDPPIAVGEGDGDSSRPVTTRVQGAFVPGLFCYRVDKNCVVVGGALTDGGSVVEWARQLLNLDSSPEAYQACLSEVQELIDQELELASADVATEDQSGSTSSTAAGASFVPFLSGERNPGFRDAASGCLFGLRKASRPSHVLKACLEGVTLRIHAIVSLLRLSHSAGTRDLGVGVDVDGVRIVASGGALEKSGLWRQMVADCTGLAVVFEEDSDEATSRGVAILVARALSASSTAASLDDPGRRAPSSPLSPPFVEEGLKPRLVSNPRPHASTYWKRLAREQDRLLEALSPLYHDADDAYSCFQQRMDHHQTMTTNRRDKNTALLDVGLSPLVLVPPPTNTYCTKEGMGTRCEASSILRRHRRRRRRRGGEGPSPRWARGLALVVALAFEPTHQHHPHVRQLLLLRAAVADALSVVPFPTSSSRLCSSSGPSFQRRRASSGSSVPTAGDVAQFLACENAAFQSARQPSAAHSRRPGSLSSSLGSNEEDARRDSSGDHQQPHRRPSPPQHDRSLLEGLLRDHSYAGRLRIVDVERDLPLWAEAYLQGTSKLVRVARIVADPAVAAASTNTADASSGGAMALKEPRAVIEIAADDAVSGDATTTTTVAPETMTVDLSQITTVYFREEIAASRPSHNSNNNGAALRVNERTLERAMDHLYGSRVGRGRSTSSGLSKKQVADAVQQGLVFAQGPDPPMSADMAICYTYPTPSETAEHAERVLRQAIKIGSGSTRLVDSLALATWFRPSGAPRNRFQNEQDVVVSSALDLDGLRWAGQALANDARTGGRFKRWPCVAVGCTAAANVKWRPAQPDPMGVKPSEHSVPSASENVTVTSLSFLNGGWLAVDQSVRAGTEARKFVERRVAPNEPSSQGDPRDGHVSTAQKGGAEGMSPGPGIHAVRTPADLRILQRLECLAMGEDLSSPSGDRMEVDVRETLTAMNCELSPQGARQALLRVGWWTRDISSEFSRVEPWSSTVLEAAAWFVSKQRSIGQALDNARESPRSDLTRYPSLCIDAQRTKFRDDALGLRPRADTGRPVVPGASKWEVLVHIVDVSDIYGVNNGPRRRLSDDHKMRLSRLKDASKSRGTSRYDLPLGPLHLMPPRVLEALSFSDKNSQRCLTLWAYVDERDGKLLDCGFERTLVREPTTLTYREATDLLEDTNHDSNVHSNMRPLLMVLNRVLGRWGESHMLDHEASRRRQGRLAMRQRDGGSATTISSLEEDDGSDRFQRSSGHILVDAALELYSTGASAMLRNAGAPIPQARGAESFRGGRVATAPLRRFIDGETQRQLLAVLFNQGRRISAKECAEIGMSADSARNSIANVRAARSS